MSNNSGDQTADSSEGVQKLVPIHNASGVSSSSESTSSTHIIPQNQPPSNVDFADEDELFLEKQLALFEIQEWDEKVHAILQNKKDVRDFIINLDKKGLLLRRIPNLSRRFRPTAESMQSTVYFVEDRQNDNSSVFVRKVVKRISFPLTNRLKTLREIKITTELNHPNIIRPEGYFFDAGTDTDQPFCYIVMPYIKYDLLSWMAEEENTRFHLPTGFRCTRKFDEVRRVLTDFVKVLHYFHSETKYIHMDIKFDNVLITEEGKVILIDFGLAKDTSNLTSQAGFTQNFAAPEVRAYNSIELKETKLTNKIDIYSFGAMLYYLFVDCDGKGINKKLINFDQIMQRMHKIFSIPKFEGDIVDFISDLIVIIDKCLSDDPDNRPTAFLLRRFSFFSEPNALLEELSSEEKEWMNNFKFAKALNFIIDQREFDKGFKLLTDLANAHHHPSAFYVMIFIILKEEFPEIDMIKPKSLETLEMLTSWKAGHNLKGNHRVLFDIAAKSKDFFEKNAALGDKHSLFALGFINYYGDKELSHTVSQIPKEHELAKEFLNQILANKEQKPSDGFLEQSKIFVPLPGDSKAKADLKLCHKKFLRMLHENGKLCSKPEMKILGELPKRGFSSVVIAQIFGNEWDHSWRSKYVISTVELSVTKPLFLEKNPNLSHENISGIEKMFFEEKKGAICLSIVQRYAQNGFFDWLFNRDPEDPLPNDSSQCEWEMIDKKNLRTFEDIRSTLIEALRAIYHLHCHQFVHGNINFDSFRITDRWDCYRIKLTELASIREANTNNSDQYSDILPLSAFSAPELSNKSGEVDINSDIYSFGVMLYILFVAPVVPQPGEKVCKEQVSQRIKGVFLSVSSKVDPVSEEVIKDLCEIIEGCLEEEPCDRPCAMTLLNNHEFFSRKQRTTKKKK